MGLLKSVLALCHRLGEMELFLKSIELYGFKSFADKTRLEFAHGTTSLLGPNGCGKSNIVDAIKWVLGEQSTKTLRASKMEDVIFNGTEKRPAMSVAEVSLIINNEQNLLPTEHSEVEIKRRLFRSGESEFFINRVQVRLKDIRELFFDTGVGKSAYSILEQGKIDQILSHKPEDRRYIFEEAAGITRFKQRSEEALRKLERTSENIEQVETLLSEIKRQYDSRKGQAAKAARYKELEKELIDIEVNVALSTIHTYLKLQDTRKENLIETQDLYEQKKETIQERSLEISQLQDTLHTFSEQKLTLTNALQRFDEQKKGTFARIDLLTQRYHDFTTQKNDAINNYNRIKEKIEIDKEQLEDQEDKKESLEKYIKGTLSEQKENKTEIEKTTHLITSIDEEILTKEELERKGDMRQEELSLQLRSITDKIVEELEQLLSEHNYSSHARSKALTELNNHIASIIKQVERWALVAPSMMEDESFDKEEDVHREIIISLENVKSEINNFSSTYISLFDSLTSPKGTISQKRGIDELIESTRKEILSLRESVLSLRNERGGLVSLLEQYRTKDTSLQVSLSQYKTSLEATNHVIENLNKVISEKEFSLEDALSDSEVANVRMGETMEKITQIKDEQVSIDDELLRHKESLEELEETMKETMLQERELQKEQQQEYEHLNEMRSSMEKYRLHIDSLHEQIQQVYHLFYDTYGRSLKEYDSRLSSELESETSLREDLIQLKKQMGQMGYINHMAEREFEEIKERYDFLSLQHNDLVKAKENLEKVVVEIKERSEELFLTSYHQIRANFHTMFHRMFAGGRAELRLLDPEDILHSGIEIYAQPPGKKLDRLAPLSGGEKSLTAVALLFATYKVKPSPFCILDEIDAALDDRNIGSFLSVLNEFSETSQFIIITHNKHTVMGSQTLLGVTMQEKGVSKAISYKMGWEKDESVIHDAHVDNAFNNTV
ncbi:MAG: chromosome segregation protein SMC [Spirochaetia bacterium]|nr:chromosome segregation protein SMC [Spirochaetia bacterium]